MQVERAKACARADRAGRYLSLNNATHLSNSPIKCDKAIILIKCFNMHSLSDHLSSKHGVQEEDVPHQCKFCSFLWELATWQIASCSDQMDKYDTLCSHQKSTYIYLLPLQYTFMQIIMIQNYPDQLGRHPQDRSRQTNSSLWASRHHGPAHWHSRQVFKTFW